MPDTPRIPPPVFALLLAGLGYAASQQWPYHAAADLYWPASRLLGLPLLAAGGLLALVCIGQFIRARTTINPHTPHKSSALVTGGAYRISRNPMYLSLLLILLAWLCWLAFWPALLAAPVAFILMLNRFQIQPEEAALAQRFGADYLNYCRRTRRWF